MGDILHTVAVGDHQPGIVRTSHGLLLSRDVRQGGGTHLEDGEAASVDVGGVTVAGGRVPDGAVAAVAIDDAGDEHAAAVAGGTWLAVLGAAGFDEGLVRFTDPAGALVAQPLPAGDRAAIEDATERCPVCGGVAWITVGEDAAGLVACGACGLQIGGALVLFGSAPGIALVATGDFWVAEEAEDDDFDDDAFDDDAFDDDEDVDEEWERDGAAALEQAGFAVYAARGREVRVQGWSGGDGDPVDAVDIEHPVHGGMLTIESLLVEDDEDFDAPRVHLRLRLADLLEGQDEDPPQRSEAGLRVWQADRERAGRRAAARVSVERRPIPIDGRPEPFDVLAAEGAWVAVRDHHGVLVTVMARGVGLDDLVLERVVQEGGTTAEADRQVAARRRAAEGTLLVGEEVAALIDEGGLGEHREAILRHVLAGYRLVPDDAGPVRIGGLPDLAEGEAWPHGADGIAMTLVAQIDTSALAPLTGAFAGPPWRHEGRLLRIFAALDARIPEPGPAVGLSCAPGVPLTRATLPPRPDPLPPTAWEAYDESLRLLAEARFAAEPFLTVPVAWTVLGDTARETRERYRAFAARLRAGGGRPRRGDWQVAQLLGHGESMQGDDPRLAGDFVRPEIPGRDAWRILLNVPAHAGMSFGDGGALAVLAPVDDLASGRYDRLATEPSMG